MKKILTTIVIFSILMTGCIKKVSENVPDKVPDQKNIELTTDKLNELIITLEAYKNVVGILKKEYIKNTLKIRIMEAEIYRLNIIINELIKELRKYGRPI